MTLCVECTNIYLRTADKPDSVVDHNFSCLRVATPIIATNPGVERAEQTLRPYLVLLQVGFATRHVAMDTRELLPHVFTIAGFAS